MVALSLQTLLLMGGAYLLGAIVACAARRTLARAPAQSSATAERRVDPLPEMVQAGTAELVQPVAETRPPVPETAPIEPEPAPVKPAIPTATTARPAQEPVQPAQEPTHPAQGPHPIQGIDAALASALGRLGMARRATSRSPPGCAVTSAHRAVARTAGPNESGRTGSSRRRSWPRAANTPRQPLCSRRKTANAEADPASRRTPPDSDRRCRDDYAAARPDHGTPHARPLVVPRPLAADDLAPKPVPPPVRQPEPATPPRPRPRFSADAGVPRRLRGVLPPRRRWSPRTAPSRRPQLRLPQVRQRSRPCGPPSRQAPMARDNLQRISGIDAQTEQRSPPRPSPAIADRGTGSPWTSERSSACSAPAAASPVKNWIEQAEILSRGGDTAFSREFDRREAEGSSSSRAPPS